MLLLLLSKQAGNDRLSGLIIFGGTILICSLSVAAVVDTVFIHIGAQGGLVFLFLPIYQWTVVGILGLLYYAVSRSWTT